MTENDKSTLNDLLSRLQDKDLENKKLCEDRKRYMDRAEKLARENKRLETELASTQETLDNVLFAISPLRHVVETTLLGVDKAKDTIRLARRIRALFGVAESFLAEEAGTSPGPHSFSELTAAIDERRMYYRYGAAQLLVTKCGVAQDEGDVGATLTLDTTDGAGRVRTYILGFVREDNLGRVLRDSGFVMKEEK